jgi:hypothetical protein
MAFLESAIVTARSRGYLPLQSGMPCLREAPEWLDNIQLPGGVARLETHLGVTIPEAVREFWAFPSLVRLLDSWRWQDYLCEEPAVVVWDKTPHLLVCSHPHSGGIGAVRLGAGDDPPMYWGWEDEESSLQLATDRFSEHVRIAVEHGPSGGTS